MKALLSHPLFSHTLVRFILAGGVNTAFGLAAYTALALTSLQTWAVVVISNLLGLAFNSMTTGGLVFRDMGLARAPRFVLCYAMVLLGYWFLIDRLSPIVGGRIQAMAIVVLPMTAITYLVQSRFVFRKPVRTEVEPPRAPAKSSIPPR